MSRNWLGSMTLLVALLVGGPAAADQLPPDASYRPLPTLPFEQTKANDEAQKPQVMQRQERLLNQRYDLSDQPDPGRHDVRRAKAGAGRRARQAAAGSHLGQPGGDVAATKSASADCCPSVSCRYRM